MKWVLVIIRGLVNPSEAFTVNEVGAGEVYGLTEESFGFWGVAG